MASFNWLIDYVEGRFAMGDAGDAVLEIPVEKRGRAPSAIDAPRLMIRSQGEFNAADLSSSFGILGVARYIYIYIYIIFPLFFSFLFFFFTFLSSSKHLPEEREKERKKEKMMSLISDWGDCVNVNF